MTDKNLCDNQSEASEKSHNRTHHTRFFEKLYGNLEQSSNSEENVKNSKLDFPINECSSRDIVHSPSESSGSSCSDINITRFIFFLNLEL
jgi:hypothetical protein